MASGGLTVSNSALRTPSVNLWIQLTLDNSAETADAIGNRSTNLTSSPAQHDGFQPALINRLPPEMLGRIFMACHCQMHVKSAPLLLTLVCRHWRDIAHGTPQLWNKISPEWRSADPWRGVSLFLEHSGELSISLDLSFCPLPDNATDRWNSIGDLVRSNLHRVQHLSLAQYDLELYLCLFPHGSETEMPLLEHLSIAYPDAGLGASVTLGRVKARRLRELWAPDPTTLTVLLPRQECLLGLREVYFRGDTSDHWLVPNVLSDVLRTLAQIEILNLQIRGPRRMLPDFKNPAVPPASIRLPRLHDLRLDFPSAFDATAFLAALVTPSLRKIYIGCYRNSSIEPVIDFGRTIGNQAIYGSLEEIELEGHVRKISLSLLLRASPNLKKKL
jgi:hypothetical protein